MRQRRPTSSLGVRIVTLLSFTGPMLPFQIAKHLGIREETARDECIRLMSSEFVRLSAVAFSHYESTGIFDPDLDQPRSLDAHAGPPCPADCPMWRHE